MTNHNDVIYNIQIDDNDNRIEVIQSGANGPAVTIRTVNGLIGDVVLDTDDISEGSTNLYYTTPRANAAIDVRVNKAYIDALDVNSDTLDGKHGTHYLNYNNFTNTPSIPSTTTDISEGTNLYFTNERVDDRVSNLITAGTGIQLTYDDVNNILTINSNLVNSTTDDLTEGTNLYYTEARVDAAIDLRVTQSYVNNLDIDSDTLDGYDGVYYLNYTNMNNKPFIPETTTDISEGTNLYFTNERVDDRVSNLITAGTGIDITYDDVNNTLTINSDLVNSTTDDINEGVNNKYFTDERVDDRVSNLLVEGSGIQLTYDDVVNTLTIESLVSGYGREDFDNDFASVSTDDLTEGTTNLYFTDERAQSSIMGGTGVYVTSGEVSIGQSVGVTDNVKFNNLVLDGNLTVNGTTTTINATELDIGDNIVVLNSGETGTPTQDAGIEIERGTSENVRIVWDETATQWTVGTEDFSANTFIGDLTGQVSDITNHTTSELTEGTNLYYTDTRVNSAIDSRVDKTFVDALNINSDTLDGEEGSYYLDYNNLVNTPSIPSTTTDISEGTNLYFTDERVDDRVSNLITAGAGIDITYDDIAGTLTIDSNLVNSTTDDLTEGTNLYFTDERVDDRVSNLITAGAGIDITYDDIAGTLTIDGQAGYTTTDFDTDFSVKTTSELTEGTNLYYTDTRVNSAIDSRVNSQFIENLGISSDPTVGTLVYTFQSNEEQTINLSNTRSIPVVGVQKLAPRKTTDISINADTNNQDFDIYDYSVDEVLTINVSSPWNIDDISYSNTSYNTSLSFPTGLFFKPDGTSFYTAEDNYQRYDMSTAWDLGTASLGASVAPPNGIESSAFTIKPDGTKLYTFLDSYQSGNNDNRLYEYNFGTAWDLSTLTEVSSVTLADKGNGYQGVVFNDAGTIISIPWRTSKKVSQYSLSTPWDITTQSLLYSFDYSEEDSSSFGDVRSLSWGNDGLSFYLGGLNGILIQYDLTTPYELSTASYIGSNDISSVASDSRGLCFDANDTKLFVMSDSGIVYDYELAEDVSEASVPSGTFTDANYFGADPTGLKIITNSGSAIISNSNGTIIDVDNLSNGSYASNLWKLQGLEYTQSNIKVVSSSTDIGPSGIFTAITKSVSLIDNSTWSNINSITISDNSQSNDTAYYAITTDNRDSYFIINSLGFIRKTVRNNSGTWEVNYSSSFDFTAESWFSAFINNEVGALEESLFASQNLMTANDLINSDTNSIPINSTIGIAALLSNTDASDDLYFESPVINYDDEIIDKGAIIGTDYDYEVVDDSTVIVTALKDLTLSIRIV